MCLIDIFKSMCAFGAPFGGNTVMYIVRYIREWTHFGVGEFLTIERDLF